MLSFVAGIIFSVIVYMLFSYVRYYKLRKIIRALSSDKKSINASLTPEQTSRVQEKMKRVRELTNLQLELLARASEPQKNALDGKYKNGLLREIEEIKKEQLELLNSIVTEDKIDPLIATVDHNNQVKTLRLSEYIAQVDNRELSDTTTKTKRPNLVLYHGGKSDTPPSDLSN